MSQIFRFPATQPLTVEAREGFHTSEAEFYAREIYRYLYTAVPWVVTDRVRALLMSDGAQMHHISINSSRLDEWNKDLAELARTPQVSEPGSRPAPPAPGTFADWLIRHDACGSARRWVAHRTLAEVYENADETHYDWVEWLCGILDLEWKESVAVFKATYTVDELAMRMNLVEAIAAQRTEDKEAV